VTTAAPPALKSVIARVAASLMIACVIPAVLFALVLVTVNVTTAIIAGFWWTCSAIGWRWVTKRPISWLLLLTLAVMTARTSFTLATGNTFVYFVQPVFADATVATLFLVSLCSARPIVARLAPDFYPVDADLAANPQIRRLFWRLTLMWGLVIVAKASLTFWLLTSLPMVDFIVIKNASIFTLTAATAAVTIWLSAIVVKKEYALVAIA
jgi:hypothetical protein